MNIKPALVAMVIGMASVIVGCALGKSNAAGLFIMIGLSSLVVMGLLLNKSDWKGEDKNE